MALDSHRIVDGGNAALLDGGVVATKDWNMREGSGVGLELRDTSI